MRIAIGCDDTGFPLKEQVSAALEASGHELLDLGTFSAEPVDHPDYARAVGQAVLRGFVDTGMLICGSGAGGSIAANKLRGIRAALCHDPEAARLTREEDDANVLCLGARELDPIRAVAIAMAWLGASYSGEERFARKIAKVALLEGGLPSLERAPTRQATATAAGKPSARETPRPVQKMPAGAPIASPPWPVQKMPIDVPVASDAGGAIRMDDYVGATSPPAKPRPVDEVFKLPAVQETLDGLEAQDFLDRLWVKDAS